MIETKLFEVRDRMTFLPVICMRIAASELPAEEQYLARRAGYAEPLVIMTHLQADHSTAVYHGEMWADRTRRIAHSYIADRWYDLQSGAVIDVEFILGEVTAPKVSERIALEITAKVREREAGR